MAQTQSTGRNTNNTCAQAKGITNMRMRSDISGLQNPAGFSCGVNSSLTQALLEDVMTYARQ